MATRRATDRKLRLPDWVPKAVAHYLQHTEAGVSIRSLARSDGCHASTVLRQIRSTENRRDDPLIDDALLQLSTRLRSRPRACHKDNRAMNKISHGDMAALTDARIAGEAMRIMRRLVETGAVLAVARDMDMAVVVRDGPDGATNRTAVVDREIAQAMAVRDWIASADPAARIARYHITSVGRSALKLIMAEAENRASGFAEAPADFADQHREWGDREVTEAGQRRQIRTNLAESPLIGLARRKDRDGKPFLSRDLVLAGERLREDFELAQMSPQVTQNWDRFLTGPGRAQGGAPTDGATAARDRVAAALTDLGPGLGDVVLRCCCFLEGMEHAEKRMGWSARSGKIVLRIALLRLKRHYDETQGKYRPRIG
jgi:hypothetical protein